MSDALEKAEVLRQALARAIEKEFDRKRRLGQYAVVMRNGKPTKIWFNPDGSERLTDPNEG